MLYRGERKVIRLNQSYSHYRRSYFVHILVVLSILFSSAVFHYSFAEDEYIDGVNYRIHGYTEGTLKYDAVYLDPHNGPGYWYYGLDIDLPKVLL